MIPKPPICISTRSTISPKNDQCAAVSCTASPVTHTAEVAVNRADVHEALSPPRDRDRQRQQPCTGEDHRQERHHDGSGRGVDLVEQVLHRG
ncbi:hypothetical protein GCM10018952_46780 [Streptosporangium vulgare]